MANHRASAFPEFRGGGINHTPPPTAIGVTRRTGVVGARQLQFQVAPAHENTITRQGSLQRIGNSLRQTGDIDSTARDLDAEWISITDPLSRRRQG